MNSDKAIFGSPNKLLDNYIKAYGKDLLVRRISGPVPNGWAKIVIEMFWQIKNYHPGAKITSMLVAPISRHGSGVFSVSIATPTQNSSTRIPKLPRSLKWITEQARKKAFSTCAACGHPVEGLTSCNLCALCACKIGIRHFSE